MEIDEVERRITQLEIERQALKKEDDAASFERLSILERELANLREKSGEMKIRWQNEKEVIARIRELKEKIEQTKLEEQNMSVGTWAKLPRSAMATGLSCRSKWTQPIPLAAAA